MFGNIPMYCRKKTSKNIYWYIPKHCQQKKYYETKDYHCTKIEVFSYFFSKCEQIRRKPWIWSHLLH